VKYYTAIANITKESTATATATAKARHVANATKTVEVQAIAKRNATAVDVADVPISNNLAEATSEDQPVYVVKNTSGAYVVTNNSGASSGAN
jgi:hypothetical protein